MSAAANSIFIGCRALCKRLCMHSICFCVCICVSVCTLCCLCILHDPHTQQSFLLLSAVAVFTATVQDAKMDFAISTLHWRDARLGVVFCRLESSLSCLCCQWLQAASGLLLDVPYCRCCCKCCCKCLQVDTSLMHASAGGCTFLHTSCVSSASVFQKVSVSQHLHPSSH